MRIAVTGTKPDLDSEIDPRFGRCRYFILVDPDTMQFEAVENASAMSGGGVGIAAAQIVADKKVEAVLTGNCGPNAYNALSSAGVKVITGVAGNIREAIESYKAGKLQSSSQPNVKAHSGMNPGMGTASN